MQLPTAGPLVRAPSVDLGCGLRPEPGSIGLDYIPLPGVAVVARLDAPHLPFRAGSLARVVARHVLEHLDDVPAALAEIHRVLQPGGACTIEVPYFASATAYADPTHRARFTYTTFEHFQPPVSEGWRANLHTWFNAARFRIVRRHLSFGMAHQWLGVAALANRFPNAYEALFVYLCPARALEVELERLN